MSNVATNPSKMRTDALPRFINIAVIGTLNKNNYKKWWDKPSWVVFKAERKRKKSELGNVDFFRGVFHKENQRNDI